MDANCYACGGRAKYSILLAQTDGRLYIPNQLVRDTVIEQTGLLDHGEVAFCAGCMRKIEDGLRATVSYLQSENGVAVES